jgi:hypothetical protein
MAGPARGMSLLAAALRKRPRRGGAGEGSRAPAVPHRPPLPARPWHMRLQIQFLLEEVGCEGKRKYCRCEAKVNLPSKIASCCWSQPKLFISYGYLLDVRKV